MDSTLVRRLAQAARERSTASRARRRAIAESGQVQNTIRASDVPLIGESGPNSRLPNVVPADSNKTLPLGDKTRGCGFCGDLFRPFLPESPRAASRDKSRIRETKSERKAHPATDEFG